MLLNCGLEKTLESPLDCKEIQPVHSKGDQSWVFIGRTDVEGETPVLWPLHAKSWLIGKDSDAGRDWGQEEKETTQDEMAGWHHGLDGCESEWTPGDGEWLGLICSTPWGCKEWDSTEPLNNNSLEDARDRGLISGLGRPSRIGNGNPLQNSCLENSMPEETGTLQSMGLQIVGHNSAQTRPQSYEACIVSSFFCFFFVFFFNEGTLGSLVNMFKDVQAERAWVRFKLQSFTARTYESPIVTFTWLETSVLESDGDKGNKRSKKERKLLGSRRQPFASSSTNPQPTHTH